MFDTLYIRQAKLLLRCIPEINRHACFALKGGTAINLFFRPMPPTVGRHRPDLSAALHP